MKMGVAAVSLPTEANGAGGGVLSEDGRDTAVTPIIVLPYRHHQPEQKNDHADKKPGPGEPEDICFLRFHNFPF